MRFGSVCSGIEAASVAWHPLEWRAAWFSEIEPFPCAVLAHHYPEVPNHGDMTALPQLIRSGKVEAPDLFCGGTPCQAFSVAGLRRSLDDERGNLSLTFVEIADAIDDVRRARGDAECIVFWENVPGVLSTADNAFGCFLGALAGCDTAIEPLAATGWTDAGVVAGPVRTVAWRVLDAQYFGLAQRRRRVFVVASAREGFDPAAVLLEFEGVRRDSAPSREAGKVAPTIPSRSTGGGGLGTDFDCDGGVIQAFGGNRTSGSIDITPALLAQPGSGWKGDFESETFVTQEPMFLHANKGRPAGRQSAHTEMVSVKPLVETLTTDGHSQSAVAVPVEMRESGQGYWMQDDIVGTLRAEGEDRPSRPSHVIGVPVAHAFDARQSDVIQYGDKTGPLDTDGHSVAVAVRTANTSANGHGISAELAHTLDRAQGQAVIQPVAFHENQRAEVTLNDTAGSLKVGGGKPGQGYPAVLAPTLTASNDLSRSPQSSEITAQVAAVVQATAAWAIGSHAGAADGDQTNRSHASGGPVGSNISEECAYSLRSGRTQNVATPMQVRRLTPVECERLQGFPDDYTAIPWRGKPASECPDGPRYKALGNSWAVPCVRWIGRRIAAQIA